MSAEFDRLVAEFEKFESSIRNADERLANLGGMQAEIAELEATATSPDRAVSVTAGPGGGIKGIQLTEEAMRQRPQALAAPLLATLQQAVAESARRQATIVDTHMGGDLHATEQVLEAQAELFGTTVEDMRSKLEEEQAPARRRDEREDYSDQSFLSSANEPKRPEPPSSPGGNSSGDQFLKNLFEEDDR